MGVIGKLGRSFNPKSFEEEVLKYWKEKGVYEKAREEEGPKFYFLDGPPYPSSEMPHIGTAWNKIIKDAVIRYKRSRGFKVNDKPGYDCHGLPIEVAVEKMLGFTSKKDIENFGVERFVEECRKLALSNLSKMSQHFENLGVSMDWKAPYLTLDKEYIESAWWLIKRVWEEGLLERGLKVVHWCPRCETVLADYEVSEYKELEDPSIYVKFPVKEEEGAYILIWTTTPWTLPANVAVMVHPDFDYAYVRYRNEVLIMAKDRVKDVFKEIGGDYKIVKVVKGRELEGLRYEPPLADEVPLQGELSGAHKVVLSAEYVNLLEGTGCVHSAPGHGEEDFEVAKRYGLPIVMPVDAKGVFTEEGGKYKGLEVRRANELIIEDLKRKGLLLHRGTIKHRYPVCWRCKTPLLLRATKQWVIKVTELKDRLLDEAQKVNWIPPWAGLHRFRNWLEGLKDWIISRQRYWGTPLPIWTCEQCGKVRVIGSLRELEEATEGRLELRDLHRPWIDKVTFRCDRCGGTMRRVEDVLDVWFDSGIAFYASLGYPFKASPFNELWPVDFIVEGHDQIAGWFFSLLKVGVLGFKRAPYRTVLMHGFALDEKGRPMHKSLGNYVSPADVLRWDRGSRDVLRFYLLQNIPWEDLRFSWNNLKLTFNDLNVLWNVYVFASTYMNLDSFDPSKWGLKEVSAHLKPEDRWILSRVESLTKEVTEYMDRYLLHLAVRRLRDFIVEDVSHWYIKLIRRRVWVEGDSPDKMAAYVVLHHVLSKFLKLASPFIPFTTEKIFLEMFKPAYGPAYESVHLMPWPKVEEELIDAELERAMDEVRELVECAYAARMKAGIKIRQPLPEAVIVMDDELRARSVRNLQEVFVSQANVRELRVVDGEGVSRYLSIRLSVKTPELKGLEEELLKALKLTDVLKILRGKEVKVSLKGRELPLDASKISVTLSPREGFVLGLAKSSLVLLNTRLGEEEIGEGLAKDLIRRIQYMRKLLDLPVDAYISVTLYTTSEKGRELLAKFKEYIARETRATSIKFVKTKEGVKGSEVRAWEIEGEEFLVGIERERNE